MSLTLDENASAYLIRGYIPGQILINELVYYRSMIISSDRFIPDWSPQTLHELKSEHLSLIKELAPSILLIGTGEHLFFPALEIYGDLINHGIGVEIMNTKAACQTFNVLTAEKRNVYAALIIK